MTDFPAFDPLFSPDPPARFGLFTDFDGTLSPVVPDPQAARPTPRAIELLQELTASAALVAVISGRGVADLAKRVGVVGVTYVGNHGLETWDGAHAVHDAQVTGYLNAIGRAAQALASDLQPGMHIEDKQLTLSLHYRQAPAPEDARAHLLPIAQRVANEHGLVLFEGRRIIELRPPIAIDKGAAFRRLVREHDLDAAVYIGDDTTDVAAFKAARDLRENGECRGYALGVVDAESPPEVAAHADGIVSSIEGVEGFLAWCLSKLSRSST